MGCVQGSNYKYSEKQVRIACNGTCTCTSQFFQPLDLTVNRAAKNQTKKEFISWYSAVIQHELNEGKALEDIDVDLKLTVIKPLHAQWLVNVYNFFLGEHGQEVILKGWKKAGIVGLFDGSTVLPPLDPFQDFYKNKTINN